MGSSCHLWEGGDAAWIQVCVLGSGVQPLTPRAWVSEKRLLLSSLALAAKKVIVEAWALDLTFLN